MGRSLGHVQGKCLLWLGAFTVISTAQFGLRVVPNSPPTATCDTVCRAVAVRGSALGHQLRSRVQTLEGHRPCGTPFVARALSIEKLLFLGALHSHEYPTDRSCLRAFDPSLGRGFRIRSTTCRSAEKRSAGKASKQWGSPSPRFGSGWWVGRQVGPTAVLKESTALPDVLWALTLG